MATVASRVANWVDLVVELLGSSASSDYPVDAVGRGLLDTFDAQVAALNWRSPTGSVAMQIVENDHVDHNGLTSAAAAELVHDAANSDLMEHHPLAVWNHKVDGTTPQTLQRVPKEITIARRTAEVLEVLHAVGVDQELALPLACQGRAHLAYSISRPGREDFSAEDLQVAVRIRPLLMGLQWQEEVLGRYLPQTASSSCDLTGRELAVLQLLANGLTARAISSRLGCSIRTVHKHLEHLYRKLGISDRVSAVRIGEAEGLVLQPYPLHHPAQPLGTVGEGPIFARNEPGDAADLPAPVRDRRQREDRGDDECGG